MASLDGNWDADKLVSGDLIHDVSVLHLVAYINESNKGDGDLPPTHH